MDIKTIAKKHGLTMGDVADRMGITRITLSQNISGNPTLFTLRKIADAIGCKIGDFFEDERSVPEVTGIVRVGDEYHEVSSLEELKKLVK